MSKSGNRIVLVVVIVVVLLGAATAIWYWGIYLPEEEAKEKARLEQLAQQQAEQKRKEEAAKKKADYDQFIEAADTDFELENWASAESLYSQALALFPNQQYPQDQLAIVNGKLDEIAEREARIAAGIIETVSEPTGRFYVIISSSLDGDLAMDYASKLSKEGNSVKVVLPHAKNKFFHRVAIAEFDSWDQAANSVSSYNTFSDNVWVLKF